MGSQQQGEFGHLGVPYLTAGTLYGQQVPVGIPNRIQYTPPMEYSPTVPSQNPLAPLGSQPCQMPHEMGMMAGEFQHSQDGEQTELQVDSPSGTETTVNDPADGQSPTYFGNFPS
jgi:hypothetical protein